MPGEKTTGWTVGVVGGVVTGVVIAALAWLVGLLSVPTTVGDLKDAMKETRQDVKTLLEAKGALEQSARDAADGVKDLRAARHELDTSVEQLKTTVGELSKLAPELRELREAVSGLKETMIRMDETLRQGNLRPHLREASLIVTVSGKDVLAKESGRWMLRAPVPKEVSGVQGVVRVEPIDWPVGWNGVAVEAVLQDVVGMDLHILVRGQTEQLREYLLDKAGSLTLRVVLALKE